MSLKLTQYDVLENGKNIFFSESSLKNLMNFERVLNRYNIYVYENWAKGELVEGPIMTRYHMTCTFMWPRNIKPNEYGAKMLRRRGISAEYKKSFLYRPEPQLEAEPSSIYNYNTDEDPVTDTVQRAPVWLVTITMPLSDIDFIEKTYSELEQQKLNLEDVEEAEEESFESVNVKPAKVEEEDVDTGDDDFGDDLNVSI